VRMTLTQRWQARSRRERTLLLVAGIALLLLLPKLLSLPLTHYRNNGARQVILAQQELRWLEQHQTAIADFLTQRGIARTQPLADLVSQRAKAMNLPFTVTTLPQTKSVSVSASASVAFPRLIDWLMQLNESEGVQVTHLAVKKNAQGITLIRLELQKNE